jgi:hypothetical protein
MTDLEIPLHVKLIRLNGENTQNIALVKLNPEYVECYKGLERVKLGTHTEEDQIHSVMMMTMKSLPLLLTTSAQLDITV